jgi:hypothetical protein
LVHGGTCWYMLVHGGACWCMVVHGGICWWRWWWHWLRVRASVRTDRRGIHFGTRVGFIGDACWWFSLDRVRYQHRTREDKRGKREVGEPLWESCTYTNICCFVFMFGGHTCQEGERVWREGVAAWQRRKQTLSNEEEREEEEIKHEHWVAQVQRRNRESKVRGEGYSLWVLFVGTLCGYCLWVLFVGTVCGYSLWVLFVGTLCGYSLWVRIIVGCCSSTMFVVVVTVD